VRAALISAPGALEVTTVPDPSPAAGEVVVEIAAVGICGTDLHILAGEHGRLPVVPGHETAGTVAAVGHDVDGLRVGDRVAVDPSLPCLRCRFCRRGRTNLCETLGALGVTVDGAAATFMRAPAPNCVVLPEHVALAGAALIEPLSCAVHGYDVLGPQPGASVLVYGAGTMGLLMVALAARTGAVSVDVVEVDADRRTVAASFGCSGVGASADELATAAWDVVIDATGNAAAIQDGVRRVARGGTFLQFGVSSPDTRVEIAPYEIYNREITITGSMAVLNSFERAADLLAAGVVDWQQFVTSQVPLEEMPRALDAFARGEGLKTQVLPSSP